MLGFCLFYIMDIYWINILLWKCFNFDENYFINVYFLGKFLWNLILASQLCRNYDNIVVLYLRSFVLLLWTFCLVGYLLYRWTLPQNDFCVCLKRILDFPSWSPIDLAEALELIRLFSLSSSDPCVKVIKIYFFHFYNGVYVIKLG